MFADAATTPYEVYSNLVKHVLASATSSGDGRTTHLGSLTLDTGNESYSALRRSVIRALSLPRLGKSASIQDASGITDELPMYGPVYLTLPRLPTHPFGKRCRLAAVVEIDDSLDNLLGVTDMADNQIAVRPLTQTSQYRHIKEVLRDSTNNA